MIFKRIYRKFRYFVEIKIKHKDSMELQIEQYRKAGMHIGERCKIYSCLSTRRDCSLLTIGNNVAISGNVTLLLHDNAPIKVSKGEYTDILGKIEIGDNCFIGHSTVILPGVHIADNTIIGAGSVVTRSIEEPGWVLAGNPAKIVCTAEQYAEKNKQYFVNLDNKTHEDIRRFSEENKHMLIQRKVLK